MPETPKDDNTPRVEEVGKSREEEHTDALETLRADVDALKASIKEDVVNGFREEIAKLREPKTDKIPEPDVERQDKSSNVKVTGHGSDVLYRGLPQHEQPFRNRHSDALAQQWMQAVRNNDWENIRRYERELNDLVRAGEIAEGTADSNGGIGSGTGAHLIPTPLANVIAENRNRRAKIRARAQVFTSPHQSIRVPKDANMTAEMVQEGNSASNTGTGLDTLVLSKKKMQVRFSITDEMLSDSPFNLVSHFTRRGGDAMGQLEDEEFATVRGQAASVTEALEAINGEAQVSPVLANRLGYADVVSLAYGLGEQWTENGTWFANRKGMQLLASILDGNGRPIFVPSLSAPQTVGDQVTGNVGSIFGRPVVQLPLTTSGNDDNLVDVWFGDLREYAILDDGGFTTKMSEHVEFDSGRVVWKVEQRFDGGILRASAFGRIQAVSGTNNVGLSDVFV